MNWDDLRLLLAAVRHGTYADAGRELGVNATTVARRIRALEEDVGVRLVRVHSRGIFPTPAGEELCHAAERITDTVADVDRRLTGRDDTLTGKVRFTTVDLFADAHAADLAAFSRQYPGVDLEVSVDNRLSDITRREADIALRFTRRPAPHLVGKRLVGLRYALYASPELADRLGRDAPLDQFPWVAWDQRFGATEQEAWRIKHALGARVAARVDSALMMYALVRDGVGVAFLVRSLAEGNPSYVELESDPGWDDPMWLLTHPDLQKTARIRAFLDFMGPRIRDRHRVEPPGIRAVEVA